MPIRLVAFDVGEVLVDETRLWGEWADWLGVSRLTFSAALGAVIAAGRHHLDTFELLRPGIDIAAARRARAMPDWWTRLEPPDLHPDALSCLRRLRERGYRVAIAGNQTREAVAALHRLGVEADIFGAAAEWGFEKPSPEFFARLIAEAGVPASEIAYIGDRVDNDVLPAKRSGMVAVFLRRGPWGAIHAARPDMAAADLRIEGLDELPAAFSRLPSEGGDAR
jgi:HAD superfamily hydrolase (TIGR01662 family)